MLTTYIVYIDEVVLSLAFLCNSLYVLSVLKTAVHIHLHNLVRAITVIYNQRLIQAF
jgi:hypothetical protein